MSVCIPILAFKFFSTLLPFLPVYTSNSDTYLFIASDMAQTSIPLLIGLRGMYCFRVQHPLNGIIALSTLTFLWEQYTILNTWPDFSKFVYPRLPGGERMLLSAN